VRIRSTPSARAALCLLAAALLVTGCTSHTSRKPPKLPILTAEEAAAASIAPGTSGGPETGTDIFAPYAVAGTLPNKPKHARIYLWPSTKPTQSDVVKLASVFGLSGTPIRHRYGWELNTALGDLRVRDDRGQRWFYSRAEGSPCAPDNFDIDFQYGDAPSYACVIDPGAGVPTKGPDEAATKAAAAALVAALGLTGDDETFWDGPTSHLTLDPNVVGLPTDGTDWNATRIDVDSRGIIAVTGPLHAPTAGDDYPLQTAKAGFDWLEKHADPDIGTNCGPTSSAATTPQPVEVPSLPCPRHDPIVITGAHLGLESEYENTYTGATIFVPVWLFTLADGKVAGTAIAVDPAYLGAPPGPSIVVTGGGASRAPEPASS